MKTYHIVVLEGDGIGPEIIDATLQVLEAVEQKEGDFHLDFQFYPAGAEHYRQTGTNLISSGVCCMPNGGCCAERTDGIA